MRENLRKSTAQKQLFFTEELQLQTLKSITDLRSLKHTESNITHHVIKGVTTKRLRAYGAIEEETGREIRLRLGKRLYDMDEICFDGW